MIGLGTSIAGCDEFNRRAVAALRGVTFVPQSWSKRFSADMVELIGSGGSLTGKQQQAMYNLVHSYRRQITDAMLTEYAARFAKGSD